MRSGTTVQPRAGGWRRVVKCNLGDFGWSHSPEVLTECVEVVDVDESAPESDAPAKGKNSVMGSICGGKQPR